MKYDQLREKALANFESLLNYWGIKFQQMGAEYDFLSPTREDTNYGACRFNIEKGRGADFAGSGFKSTDYSLLGLGFTKEDFSGYNEGTETKIGYDILGLVQRVHQIGSYKDAAIRLRDDLQDLSAKTKLVTPSRDAAERRRKEQELKNKKIIDYANKVWRACENIPIHGTPAEIYFNARGLAPTEKNIRYHPKIRNRELNKVIPTILLKVQKEPEGPLVAIHRIYLTEDGKKANVENPKMALARIKGAGIWLGTLGSSLAIVEGPENALTVRHTYRFPFVVCSINVSNFSGLTIPPYVKEITLIPDEDEAGQAACDKAIKAYKNASIKIKRAQLDWSAI